MFILRRCEGQNKDLGRFCKKEIGSEKTYIIPNLNSIIKNIFDYYDRFQVEGITI
jgi:hypothetical protein